jgi:hypothetical protein
VELTNGQFRMCGDCWPTRKEALLDAANLIRDAKKSDTCEWRNSIRTYGTCVDAA